MQLLQISTGDLQRFLDAPELLGESEEMQIAIATFSETPRSLLAVLVNSDYSTVAEAARLHVNWVGEVTEDYRKVVSEVLRDRDLGENDRLAVELMKFAPVPPDFLSEWVPVNKLIQGLKNEYMPLRYRLQLLERLAQEGELEARLQVAESSETPVSLLELLAGDLNLAVRLAVEFNDNCPSDAIDLVKSQYLKASDWDTDLGELEVLGESNWSWVRLAVAQNPFASEDVLMKLAVDDEFRIRFAVARNPGTSADVLNVLMEGGDSGIQSAIAQHPNATEEILHKLFSAHRDVIHKRNDLPASIIERFFRETFTEDTVPWKYEHRYFLLRQPNTPTWILTELANVDLEAIRAYRSQNSIIVGLRPLSSGRQEIDEEWLWDDTEFITVIIKHPQVSKDILEQLAQYPNPYIKLAIAQSQQTSEELKLLLLEELSAYPNKEIKVKLAENTNTPVHILQTLGENEFYRPKLLQEIRQVLAFKYKANENEFIYTLDKAVFDLQQNILYPAGKSIDIERYMEVIETPEIIEKIINYVSFMEEDDSDDDEEIDIDTSWFLERWFEVFPEIPQDLAQRITNKILEILETIILFGSHFSIDNSIAVAIISNPKTPAKLRESLTNQLLNNNFDDGYILLKLAYNPQVTQAKQIEYFQKAIAIHSSYADSIAMDTRTPVIYLEQLLERGLGGVGIANNPATPEYLLRKIADEHKHLLGALANNPTTPEYLLRRIAEKCDERLWVILAENPNTPVDLLLSFLNEEPEDKFRRLKLIFDSVTTNPNLPILTRYRLLLENENCENIAQVNEFMARRSDSPFALAQVVENGNQNAKLTAARNRNTPASILEQLARDSDETICQAVATNASLPFNTLLELARNSSTRVKLSLAYKSSYGNTPATPRQLLEILAEDESEQVRARIAEHPDTPVDILVKLANDSSRDVKSRLTANLNTPVEVLNRLGLEENLVNQRNPNTPGIVLAQAVRNMKSKALADFIKHPVQGSQMPPQTLAQLATNNNSSVRYRVASHSNTPATVLRQLARDSYVATIRAVASNSNTSPETLEVLSTNPDFTTRHSVVNNPNVPPRVLAQIVMSSCVSGNQPNQTVDMLKSAFPGNNNDVLRTIASNPRTPTEALEILARREFVSPTPESNSILPPTTDDSVVQSLAYNPSLTPQILATLTHDSSIDVRKILVRHPNLTEALWLRLASDEAVSVRETVADCDRVPVNVLELLASDEQTEVKVKVAANSNTPLTVLETLAGDDSQVRTAVASNPNLSPRILEQLANDEKIEVRRAVAKNPSTPVNIRESLRDSVLPPKTQQTISTLSSLPRIYNPSSDDLATVLAEYADSDNAFVRFVTLLHPVTPGEILTEGANSAFWLERYAVAENQATSLEIRERLACDGNWIVRAAANQRLSNSN